MAYHEEDLVAVPVIEQGVIAIASVGHNYAAGANVNIKGSFIVGRFTIGNVHEFRQKTIIIQ